MGKHFGELAYIRGIVSFRISPFEQKAFAGFLGSLPKTLYRVRSNFLKIVPPLALGYLVFSETEKEFQRMCRKNPADYVNDK